MTLSFSHLGICVSDLERSLRFYCEGLGFEQVASHRVGEEFAALMELEGVAVESRMLARDGVTIELLGYVSPEYTGDGGRRPDEPAGPDPPLLPGGRRGRGGVGHRGARGHGRPRNPDHVRPDRPRLDFLYCTDPDGVRIELMHLPG